MYGPGEVRVEERDEPRLVEATDAIIRVSAARVCGSDLWPDRGIEELVWPAPMGHEYVGIVEEVGAEVETIGAGQFVVGSFWGSDNTCEICRAGYQSACVNRVPMGSLGAQAERLRIPFADGTLVATPELPPDDLIPSLLAASEVLGTGWCGAVAADGLEVTWNVFQAWKQFQQDGDRDALRQRVAAIKAQMRPLLEWGSTGKRQRHVRALAKNLLKLWPALWTFADVPDVEPTNNAAERGLRAAVIYRKLSLGSRSQGGERTIERLLSVDQTCRLQRRSLYAYLSDALTAKARGDPVPALIWCARVGHSRARESLSYGPSGLFDTRTVKRSVAAPYLPVTRPQPVVG